MWDPCSTLYYSTLSYEASSVKYENNMHCVAQNDCTIQNYPATANNWAKIIKEIHQILTFLLKNLFTYFKNHKNDNGCQFISHLLTTLY